ncbi:pantoate--beta-alanine ligase [Rhodovulum sp. FJ3]|uniref:pantoate--beta-alanine ligase n=1 Tax=Rhodovulum sp. FJ3 TaxID=3079053 RepID=UPI00293DDC38|nr:pantoate--beta-alanine ligase [Rhodovulum sp. FJ3]MDV4169287.1 pantoate--beta-alanine ligase [Rhodovulum sp. FJ3]
MKRIRVLSELRALNRTWRCDGATVGVVPTMGALHQGHLSLVKQAKAACDRVIVTVFVNPKQFNNAEDLDKYPRTEDADAEALAPFDVDVMYLPTPDQIYPDGFSTNVSVSGVSEGLCGAHRPGHFDGVATVVAKLLLQTGADRAFFGEKDFQQLQVVKRLVRDLDIPTEIVGCATVREEDGLALSSRNVRLSETARNTAPRLYAILQDVADELRRGATAEAAIYTAKARIELAGFSEVEYLELRAEDGLTPTTVLDRPARLLVAAWLDGVRLIDNIPVAP